MRLGVLLLIVALVAAACASDPAPTQTPAQASTPQQPSGDSANTVDATNPTPDAPQVGVIVTRIVPTSTPLPRGALPIPGNPATLIAAETEDPALDQLFNRIELSRSEGRNDPTTIDLVIQADGSYVRNGVQGSLSDEDILALDEAIDDINFFGLQGLMLGPSGSELAYRYRLTIQRGSQQRTINSQDGFMPQPYLRFLSQIVETGLFDVAAQSTATQQAFATQQAANPTEVAGS